MKTSTIFLVLLFAFTTKTCFTALAGNEAVLDSDGNEVQPGVEYYVVSSIIGAGGGGLFLGFDPYHKCPEIVIQSPSDLQYGLPVTFSPVEDTSSDVLYEGTEVTVKFVPLRAKLCQTSTVWQVKFDKHTGKNLVILGGVEGESASKFALEKRGNLGYKFTHHGNDIGRFFDKNTGLIRLAESETPWGWTLVKSEKRIQKTIRQVVNE